MCLATLALGGGPGAVVVRDDGAVAVDAYPDVGALLRDGDRGLRAAREGERDGAAESLLAERLLRPVLQPGAIVCVGLNYRTHVLEMGRELPDHRSCSRSSRGR